MSSGQYTVLYTSFIELSIVRIGVLKLVCLRISGCKDGVGEIAGTVKMCIVRWSWSMLASSRSKLCFLWSLVSATDRRDR